MKTKFSLGALLLLLTVTVFSSNQAFAQADPAPDDNLACGSDDIALLSTLECSEKKVTIEFNFLLWDCYTCQVDCETDWGLTYQNNFYYDCTEFL